MRPKQFFANIEEEDKVLRVHMMDGCGASMAYAIPAFEGDMYLNEEYQDLGEDDEWLIKVCSVCKEIYHGQS